VEIKDQRTDSLIGDEYEDNLDSLFDHFRTVTFPALKYLFPKDEPHYGHFAANRYISDFLEAPPYNNAVPAHMNIGGTNSWWMTENAKFFRDWRDSVQTKILWFDDYRFFGDESLSGGRGPIPEDGENDTLGKFQVTLDTLCLQLANMREAALDSSKDFWFQVQAFGKYDSASAAAQGGGPDTLGDVGRWRYPTPREISLNTWLGLAHGAKGVVYWLWCTRLTHEQGFPEWIRGIWRYNGGRRDSLFNPVRDLNITLQKIGPTIMTMSSDTVFKHPNLNSPEIPPDCFIDYISGDDTVQVGTFHSANNDTFFIIANRICRASDTDTVVMRIKKDSVFLADLYTGEAILADSIKNGRAVFSFSLYPGQGRCFQLVPFAQEFTINGNQAYANMPFAVCSTKVWSAKTIDSMKISQTWPDPVGEENYATTGWISYDTAQVWRLRAGDTVNVVTIQYMLADSIKTAIYPDTILLDRIVPTGSFVINDNDKFTNSSTVTLKNSLNDTKSSMSKMRFGNKELKNLIKNSGFDTDTSGWQSNVVDYNSNYDLVEIPVTDTGNFFYQKIPPESLESFNNDTLLVWVDLVSDSFIGSGHVQLQYIYSDTSTWNAHLYGVSITIPEGKNAKVSEYNLAEYFKYYPDPDSTLTEARLGIFIHSDPAHNQGRLYVDNFRLDVVSPAHDYTKFETYDTLKNNWPLTSGNGVRTVYGQFADSAGNETGILFDTIIVDTTKPACRISSPQNNQTISDTVTISGYAYDYADPQQHFEQYELRYRKLFAGPGGDTTWYGIHPDSIFTTPVNPGPMSTLAEWDTYEVTQNHGDDWYTLRLTVIDSAGNSNNSTVNVQIDNSSGEGEGGFFGFTQEVYGVTAEEVVYIGESGTGKIHIYNTNYEFIDTFDLIDSVGPGFPLAMAMSDSGKLWVTNIVSHLINRFTSQGTLLAHFAGGFALPSGIAFDNTGHIWISDRLHHKIKKFDLSGNQLFEFGTKGNAEGELDKPMGLSFYDDKLYVADSKNERISIFDTLGQFIETIGDGRLSRPFGLMIDDSTGCIYVSDFDNDQVIEFDPYGNQLFKIDSVLNAPSGLALSKDAKMLYVSDTKNKRVLAYEVRGDPPGSGGGQSGSEIDFKKLLFDISPTITSRSFNIRLQGIAGKKVTLKIYDATGRLVKTFYDNQLVKSNQTIVWDAKDNHNRKLSSGVYFVRLETEDHKSTKKAILLR
jgi:sugar lactone lactonase YvrE